MTSGNRTPTGKLDVTGQDLVKRVRELVQGSNARRVTTCAQDGDALLSMPPVFGVVAGGLMMIPAPVLAGPVPCAGHPIPTPPA